MMMILLVVMIIVMMMMMMDVVDATTIPEPSLAPSNMPIISTTFFPTKSPIISLTNLPTITSSRFINIPTMNPSAQPYPILIFKSDFTFENITVISLDNDKIAQRTVSETTATSMNISNSCVVYQSSSSPYYYSSESSFIDEQNINEYQQNEEDDATHVLIEDMDTNDVSVTSITNTTIYNNRTIIVTTSTQIQVTGSYTSTSLYNSLTNKLTEAVESGQYTKILHSKARSYGALDLYYVNVSKVVNYDEHGIVPK